MTSCNILVCRYVCLSVQNAVVYNSDKTHGLLLFISVNPRRGFLSLCAWFNQFGHIPWRADRSEKVLVRAIAVSRNSFYRVFGLDQSQNHGPLFPYPLLPLTWELGWEPVTSMHRLFRV